MDVYTKDKGHTEGFKTQKPAEEAQHFKIQIMLLPKLRGSLRKQLEGCLALSSLPRSTVCHREGKKHQENANFCHANIFLKADRGLGKHEVSQSGSRSRGFTVRLCRRTWGKPGNEECRHSLMREQFDTRALFDVSGEVRK